MKFILESEKWLISDAKDKERLEKLGFVIIELENLYDDKCVWTIDGDYDVVVHINSLEELVQFTKENTGQIILDCDDPQQITLSEIERL